MTVSPTRAAEGTTVTITATPDEGYEVSGVTVTDADGKAIAVTNAGDGKYTFTMPAGAVNVSASFKETGDKPVDPDWDNPYSDVEKIWYYDAIKYVTENGLMDGTGKGKFEPNTKLTRAMFARILYNKAGKPAVTGTVDFTDFESGKWYSDAVVWASKNGVLKGYDDGSVGVNDKITREQLATMLWRYVGEPEASADVTVNGSPSKYAVEAMRWAVGAGVIKGDQNGNHNPRGMASRAEAAQMLTNYYNK